MGQCNMGKGQFRGYQGSTWCRHKEHDNDRFRRLGTVRRIHQGKRCRSIRIRSWQEHCILDPFLRHSRQECPDYQGEYWRRTYKRRTCTCRRIRLHSQWWRCGWDRTDELLRGKRTWLPCMVMEGQRRRSWVSRPCKRLGRKQPDWMGRHFLRCNEEFKACFSIRRFNK